MYVAISEFNRISSLDFGEICYLSFFFAYQYVSRITSIALEGIVDVSQGNIILFFRKKGNKNDN